MIADYIANELKAKHPDMTVSEQYYEANDNIIAVYDESGGNPSTYDDEMRTLNYMVWIESSDYAKAQLIAQNVFKHFHKQSNFHYTNVNGQSVKVFFITCSEPARIGVDNKKMQYSVNMSIQLREVI